MKNKNQHIYILSFDYPPSNGGIARLCFELKRSLDLEHNHVTVICPEAELTDSDGDKNVVRIPGRRGLLEIRTLWYLKKYTHSEDIIIAGNYHPEGMLALLSGRRTFILAHGAEYLPGKSFFRRFVWPLYRNVVLQKANCVIANSHYTEALVKSCSPKIKTRAVPLAVDPVHFCPTAEKYSDGRLHLCSISRLEQFKGQDFVIRTISSLPSIYKEQICLHIGGKGPYKEKLEEMVYELGLSNIVHFEGFISDDQLCDFYSSSHVFILCTREEPQNRNVEGFGLVFAEAQACGTAVIGTITGGIPDAIENGYGGWLIHQDSEVELRNLLIKLIENRDKVFEQCCNARHRIEQKVTWKFYANKINDIIYEY